MKWLARKMVAAGIWLGLGLGFVPGVISASAGAGEAIGYNARIRPIFNKHCVACHGGVKQAAGLSFIYREQALGKTKSGDMVIVPGKPEESSLLDRVASEEPTERMPPPEHGSGLSAGEVELLREWIAQGAQWEDHWSYVAPRVGELPEVRRSDWSRNRLDRRVLARLEGEGLEPSGPADRAQWLRRVTFDLTGVPPTRGELEAFVSDGHPAAAERVVDRLLASPRFGERWASMWLDLARYADTQGYEKDPHRNVWPYRDWVIRAFSGDMPFSEFTIKQLAGDLLPGATVEDRVATVFHRNTQTNTEGGTDDEEFRLAAVQDRVNTTWQVWQATTFGCTQCHSHPYDPFRNKEYYEYLSLFNTTCDTDLDNDVPLLRVPLRGEEAGEAARLDGKIAALEQQRFARWNALAVRKELWTHLNPEAACSTGQTKLVIRDAGGVKEVVAEGTLTARSEFTIELGVPEGVSQLTALRIDALPLDAAGALKIPEMGFGLSQLTATVVPPQGGGEAVVVEFGAAASDEASPQFDPERSFQEDAEGWADYTRMTHPRWAVFVAKAPVALAAGSRLKLVMRQNLTATGDIALLLRRSRYTISSDRVWTDLVSEPVERELRAELAAARAARAGMAHVAVPVMEEQPLHVRRVTYTWERGNWLEKGERVEGGTPGLLPPLPREASRDRLSLAQWLVSGENPLTGRVLVNRVWEQMFGLGIVETVEDFGSSGAAPTHPELLDELAVRLSGEWGWRMKRLVREIAVSATYGQDARGTAAGVAKDPRNRLLSRGTRRRLTAEMMRDQALFVSGLLSERRYGPPVMPPQPEGVWRTVYSGAKWETSPGADRYRRAVYTYWKRTSAYPSFLTFDAPSREVCTMRRLTTNTPLQALVTMNDPAYVECAVRLGDRMAREGGRELREQIAWALGLATGAPAVRHEDVERLERLYTEAVEAYERDPAAAQPLGAGAEAYGRSVVANAILNLDRVLTR